MLVCGMKPRTAHPNNFFAVSAVRSHSKLNALSNTWVIHHLLHIDCREKAEILRQIRPL